MVRAINPLLEMNYYLFTTGTNISIPSFYYYKIPRPGSQEKSLIFEAPEDLKLESSYDPNPPIAARQDFNLDNKNAALRDKADSGAPSKYTYDKSIHASCSWNCDWSPTTINSNTTETPRT